jgi:hypothetical protein
MYLCIYPLTMHLSIYLSIYRLSIWYYSGVELRASHLLGRHSITWVMPPALFPLVIFEISCHFLSGLWSFYLPFLYSYDDKMYHCTQPLVDKGSPELFAWAGLQVLFSWSQPPEQLGLQTSTIMPDLENIFWGKWKILFILTVTQVLLFI